MLRVMGSAFIIHCYCVLFSFGLNYCFPVVFFQMQVENVIFFFRPVGK